MANDDFFRIETQDHVAWLTLDAPDKLNAMGEAFWGGMADTVEQITADPDVRVLVVRGAGRAFSSGLDLMAMWPTLPIQPGDETSGAKKAELHRLIRRWQGAISSVERCRVPVIAAIHGPCIGAGMDLATACDIRRCSAEAIFGVRETQLGIVADVGTLQRLPSIVGPGVTRELVYTGRDFGAAEALRIGLVDKVLPDAEALQTDVAELASVIASRPPLAVQGAKAVLVEQERYRIDQSLEYVATWNAAHLVNHDLVRSVQATATGQRPEYEGD